MYFSTTARTTHYYLLNLYTQISDAGMSLQTQVLMKLLNTRDDTGCTVLHYAAAAKNGLEAFEGSLLRMGDSLTTKDAQSRSPLHVAVEHGRYSVTKRFLGTKNGFDVINDADYLGTSSVTLNLPSIHLLYCNCVV